MVTLISAAADSGKTVSSIFYDCWHRSSSEEKQQSAHESILHRYFGCIITCSSGDEFVHLLTQIINMV